MNLCDATGKLAGAHGSEPPARYPAGGSTGKRREAGAVGIGQDLDCLPPCGVFVPTVALSRQWQKPIFKLR
jgi:hypothetical protein